MDELSAITRLTDAELVAGLKRAVQNERESVADVLAHLIEFDRRKLHAPEGYPSLFHYCARELGYAEEASYKRIRAARAAAAYPGILRMLRGGRIHLGAVVAVSAQLTPANHRELLERACGLSVRELEFLVAGMAPRPDKADHMRVLAAPAASPGAVPASDRARAATPTLSGPGPHGVNASASDPRVQAAAPGPRDAFDALSAERVRIAFTAGREIWEKLERARALLRHRYPDGRLEGVIGDALGALLRAIDPSERARRKGRKRGAGGADAPASSRRIPQATRDAVWLRDAGRCTFVGPSGTRCEAHGALEIDHVRPWALGGRSDIAENLRLSCKAHNLLHARRVFGDAALRARAARRAG